MFLAWTRQGLYTPRFAQTPTFVDWMVNGISTDGTVDWQLDGIVRAMRDAADKNSV